ncbi:MAG: MFS transporter [Gemmatimonadetes bacterium]|nr:MFS transporter [Gemmatimonadota bacterium]
MTTSAPLPRSAIPIVIATVFIDVIGFGMVLPLLPSYAARLGGTPGNIGLLVASYSAIQFILAPLWGRVSDRIGRRPVLLIGLAGSVASYLVFAFANSLPLLLLSRILDGGSGATVNVAQAYLADETTPEQRTKAMGMVGAAFGLGFIVGPILGGITAAIGNTLPGIIAAIITAVNLGLAWRVLPESVPAAVAANAPVARTPWRALAAPVAVLFLATLAFSVMYVVFPLFGELRFKASRSVVSYWFAYVGLATAIVQGGLLGRLVTRLGEVGVARLGAGVMAVGFLLIPPAGALGAPGPLFYTALALLGAGFGMAGPAMIGLASRRAAATVQGRTLGVTQSASSLARIIGPIVAGAMMQAASAEGAFRLSASMAAGALLLAATLFPRERQTATP